MSTDDGYLISEGIHALLTELEKMGLVFLQDSMEYEYDVEEGLQKVSLLSEDLPDFRVGDDLMKISEYEWMVYSIGRVEEEEEVEMYRTTFSLEDVI